MTNAIQDRPDGPRFGVGHDGIAPDSRIGLGIDAGGTFTDAALYDFQDGAILATSKALTTKWRFTDGIAAALDRFAPEDLSQVGMVSVSTTLATNALVENRGQKVGALLMPPYGRFDEGDLRHAPLAVIRGYMEMTGEVVEPVDREQVASVARAMVRDHGVAAFAVSGVGATINASQELEVAGVIQEATSLGVTCGHQLSGKLGVYDRAVTAIYNAQVIPYIERFLGELQALLAERRIHAPIMVVKGDGALMSVQMAKERPVETVFSGPAASVAGARKLTGLSDALVVDIGGTTTDVAAIRNSRVETCERGNIVAGRRTHVEALNMRTKGLGGDSFLRIQRGALRIGPERVTPVASLAASEPGVRQALAFFERDLDAYRVDTRAMRLLSRTGHSGRLELGPTERDILKRLEDRPYSMEELSEELELSFEGLGVYARLIRQNAVSVSALTPTDLLHAEGRIALWDAEPARWLCSLHAEMMRVPYEAFVRIAFDAITRELAVELFEKLMEEDAGGDVDLSRPLSQAVLTKWLRPPANGLAIRMDLPYPVIGVGAPAGELLPEAVRLFNTDLITPPSFDVANAIGAITSSVDIAKSCRVAPKDNGRYAIEGLADGREFAELETAVESATSQLVAEVRQLADKCGVLNPKITPSAKEDSFRDAYGAEVFLGVVITARVATSEREPAG